MTFREKVIGRVIQLMESTGVDIMTESELEALPDLALLSIYENLVVENEGPEEDSWGDSWLTRDQLDTDSDW